MRMCAPASAPLCTGLGALAACSLSACSPAAEPAQGPTAREPQVDAPRPERQPASTSETDNCLLLVWQDQETRDERFDLENDAAEGGAISCSTGTTASRFEQVLREIRAAAQADDQAAILRETGLPLLYIDDEGNRRELTDPADIDARFSEVFDDDVLALLRRIDLDGLTVVPDQGAFLELGSVWLVVDRKGGRPRIVTINKQALGEAGFARPPQAPD